jgi:hypothetical protein
LPTSVKKSFIPVLSPLFHISKKKLENDLRAVSITQYSRGREAPEHLVMTRRVYFLILQKRGMLWAILWALRDI